MVVSAARSDRIFDMIHGCDAETSYRRLAP